ncbi:FAD-binding protein [Miniimonas arenae]|uniref:FAD-binding protein n=1 Tax=Miniimonas arenae TaxID=676201 RepID=A0A5C5BE84_9MICO|nr:FAD-binding protein [Miniimonas arenae]TNU74894.1 FAD-binding protein [Miniimonas arenae]
MSLIDALTRAHPALEVLPASAATAPYAYDAGTRRTPVEHGPVVAFPATAAEVAAVVRTAADLGVSVVPRGAGTGLSGGASAGADQLVVSTERLTRIVEISPADELAVVEPGVINADLNTALAPYGLFYAPDPASYAISTLGGNIATNAGGLRCAKYGVTRESVLALDVVLPDGALVHVGHRSIKGVTGLDLVSLFVGSEGVLGIVVGATLRLRPLPVARRTLTAFFDSTGEGARALGAITASRVRPAVVEFLDEPTLRDIDAHSGSDLRRRGASLALVELDGFGIDEQTAELITALTAAGGRVAVVPDGEAPLLWELRRSGRGLGQGAPTWYVGEDIAVPRSALPAVFDYFPVLEARYGVRVSAVAHAGDGNLHPLLKLPIPPGLEGTPAPPALGAAATDLVAFALSRGGTVSGEHGIGTVKLDWAALELDDRVQRLSHAIKDAVDPDDVLNPGKALPAPVLQPA